MRFKKIYIEITNTCNLNCSFCIKNKRKPKVMNLEEFKIILDKIKNYTNYIYLHVLGEPLLNNNINELNNSLYNELGKCYGLTDHIGILVDGTVIPCCLDTLGCIKLGNIFNETLDEILNKKRTIDMINGFKNNKKIEELCKHCNFIGR